MCSFHDKERALGLYRTLRAQYHINVLVVIYLRNFRYRNHILYSAIYVIPATYPYLSEYVGYCRGCEYCYRRSRYGTRVERIGIGYGNPYPILGLCSHVLLQQPMYTFITVYVIRAQPEHLTNYSPDR